MEALCAGPGLKHTRLMIRRKPVGLGLATGSSPGLGPTRRSRGGSPTGGREHNQIACFATVAMAGTRLRDGARGIGTGSPSPPMRLAVHFAKFV